METRVYYEDTDCAGVVYHSNYLNFMERARTELFRSHGMFVAKMAEEGFVFPVVKMEVNFKAPALHDDLLLITTTPIKVSGSSFELHQQIFRKNDTKLLVDAIVKLACIKSSGKPQRLPDQISLFLKKQVAAIK